MIMNMAGTSVIKQLPPKDLRTELRLFIAGASKPAGNPLELVRKGFSLLKALPASKDAVLEYFGSFYEKSVSSYIQELENVGKNTTSGTSFDQSIIDEIHLSLYNFISTNPFGWRFIIIKWSLSLLGELSTKYADRGRAPVNGSLSDSLQQWMSCKATRSLLDINIHCLQLIESNESFQPVTYLLDTCVKHTPHFDWVVAHIGSCFPQTVISRVLVAGLQEFAFNQGSANRPKIKSVLDILIHLAGCHQNEIENAFKELFLWSLDSDLESDERGGPLEKSATVPYILALASMSPVLLAALSSVALETLNPETLKKLQAIGGQWVQFSTSRQALFNLIIHLIISVVDNADQLFFLLLEFSSNKEERFSIISEEILGLLIRELDVSVHSNSSKIPFLESFAASVDDLFPMLLSGKQLQMSSAVAIISFIGHQHIHILPRCVSYVLLRSTADEHLDAVVKLSQRYQSSLVLAPAIKQTLDPTNKECHKKVWLNLIKLSKWEASGTFISLPILESVYSNLLLISQLLCEEQDMQTAHLIAELLSKPILDYSKQPNVPLLRAVIHAIISYFYLCILSADSVEQIKGVRIACAVMKKLCSYGGVARAFALREILESSIFRVPSVLFGAIPPVGSRLIQSHISLMEDNNKQGHLAILAQKHSKVFHAGVIGTGKRKSQPECPLDSEKVTHNTSLLISLLSAATVCEAAQPTLEAVISVALLLVELISPDVMYNGLPWPEEDFCKVTVERDLSIRRTLDNKPVVWALLTFIAHHRPALCYCSVILRAMVATLISEWLSCSQQNQKDLQSTTTKLVQLMSLGQLLPPPFTALSDVVPHIPPEQVVVLLRDCVWNYMRDNVPSPALFTRDANGVMWRDLATSRPPKQYTETLRHIMISNISSLGALYYTLFLQDQEED